MCLWCALSFQHQLWRWFSYKTYNNVLQPSWGDYFAQRIFSDSTSGRSLFDWKIHHFEQVWVFMSKNSLKSCASDVHFFFNINYEDCFHGNPIYRFGFQTRWSLCPKDFFRFDIWENIPKMDIQFLRFFMEKSSYRSGLKKIVFFRKWKKLRKWTFYSSFFCFCLAKNVHIGVISKQILFFYFFTFSAFFHFLPGYAKMLW